MFKKMAQGIKNFFQRLYGVALVLYFGGIITAAIALSVVFPFIAPVVLTAAAAVFVVSCFVLAAIQNTANAFFGLFQRSKPAAEVTVAPSTTENAPVAGSTAKVTSALAGEKTAQATETVSINKSKPEANEVGKTHAKGTALFVPVPVARSKAEEVQDITATLSMKAA